jgi:hypothetical protein
MCPAVDLMLKQDIIPSDLPFRLPDQLSVI